MTPRADRRHRGQRDPMGGPTLNHGGP